MKRLGRVLGSFLAIALTIASLQAMAETQLGGRDFNHATTGFPLSGGHATAPCETCHVGGVFKGTPKSCDGCHALGKRIVATPKSNAHIVTDAPCESCHFNTATFLGARYNHGATMPGQCSTCHNARQATGKPVSHKMSSNATASCDQCHRTTAWTPATWNHNGVVPGICSTCHNGSLATGKPLSHTTVVMATYQCDECHGFVGWHPAKYKHNTAGVCSSCHNNAVAIGKPTGHGSASIKGMYPCEDCHKIQGWFPATYTHNKSFSCDICHDGIKSIGKPTSHSPVTVKGMNPCEDCHKVQGWLPAMYTHNASGVCTTCHDGVKSIGKPTSHGPAAIKGMDPCEECHRVTAWIPATYPHNVSGLCATCHDGIKAVGKPASHMSIGIVDCSQCHSSKTTWASALGYKPATHIPYNAGVMCNNCHLGTTSVLTGTALHVQVGSIACYTCHGSNTPYPGNRQETARWPNFHESSKNPSATDCSATGCHRPAGTKGSLYVKWH